MVWLLCHAHCHAMAVSLGPECNTQHAAYSVQHATYNSTTHTLRRLRQVRATPAFASTTKVLWEHEQRLHIADTPAAAPPRRPLATKGCQTDHVIVVADSQRASTPSSAPAAAAAAIKVENEARWRLLDSVVMHEFSHRPPKSLLWLLRTIRAVFDDKHAADAVDNRLMQPHDPLPEFVYTWLFSRFGLKSLADQAYWDLHNTMGHYRKQNTEVHMFGMLMEEAFNVQVLSSYFRPPPGQRATCG